MTIKDAGGIQVTVCHTYLCMYLAAADDIQSVISILNQVLRKLGLSVRMAKPQWCFFWKNV